MVASFLLKLLLVDSPYYDLIEGRVLYLYVVGLKKWKMENLEATRRVYYSTIRRHYL